MQMKIKILILTVLILMSFVSCARKSAQDDGNGSDTVPSAASSDVITQIGNTDTAETESEHTDGQSGVTTSPSGVIRRSPAAPPAKIYRIYRHPIFMCQINIRPIRNDRLSSGL